MAHEITIRKDGFAEAAYSLRPAWHGLGQVFDHPMTALEVLTGAGLNWQVAQEEIYRRKYPLPFGPVEYPLLKGWKLNLRQDTGLILGMVTDQYKVVQNTEAFEFLDALVENHEMLYESAFSLYGGRKVVMLARMPGAATVVPGDHVLPYVLMSLSHDASEAIRFGGVATRVVCANTYSIANDERGVKSMTIRHTGDIKEKLAQARNVLGLVSRQFAQYAEISQKLAERRLTTVEWNQYLDIMCPELDPRDPDYTERRAGQLAETRMSIRLAYVNERQMLAPKTLWAAYNAVSEHIEHLPRRGASRERKAEARFNVLLYGAGMSQKERAFATACRFAGIAAAV